MSTNAVGALQEFTARQNSGWLHPEYVEFPEFGYKVVLTPRGGTPQKTFTVEANTYRTKKEAKQAVARKALTYLKQAARHAPRRIRVPPPDPMGVRDFFEGGNLFPDPNDTTQEKLGALRQKLEEMLQLVDEISREIHDRG